MGKDLKNKWLRLLSKLYERQLLLDKPVMKGSKIERVESYIDVLEQARQDVIESNDLEKADIFKSFYHDLYVIKEENIPYSIYVAEQRQARELGHGNLKITDKYIARKNDQIINDQIISLDKWLDYFLYDDEAKIYKPWEVYWVLEGLQKLGKYDKEKCVFTKRDKTTIYPFPEVNKVAVFNTLNLMEQYLKSGTSVDEIKGALGQGNFKQLYEYSLKQICSNKEKRNKQTDGIWVYYPQGSDYNVMRNSLLGKMTGWCIEAGENFAENYLSRGAFYIYYTVDKSGEYTNPRIAIRTENGMIAEIRGVLNNQNLEPEMLPILDEKLDEFPDKEGFQEKKSDMARLTEIDNKVNSGEKLTKSDICFLYEVYSEISGFGWEKDPRVEEIRSKRNLKKDLSFVYGCLEEEVATTNKEVNSKIKVFYGDIILKRNHYKLKLPKIVIGSIFYENVFDVERIVFPLETYGNVSLKSLVSAHELLFPEHEGDDKSHVGGCIDLGKLFSVDILVLPKVVDGVVLLGNLKSIEKVVLPENLVGDLNLSSLTDTRGLVFPENLTYNIFLANDIVITPNNVDQFSSRRIK